MDPAWFAVDASEPLGLWTRADGERTASRDLRRVAFEYSSRGDRVPGQILLPATGSGHPIALLASVPGSAAEAAALETVAQTWARAGAAVASIDLPLCGARASSKLGALLDAGPRGGAGRSPLAAGILSEFGRQAVLDLRRCLDALARLEDLDFRRSAFVGLGLGARVGAVFCALDRRPGAAALALAGAASDAAPELDPIRYVGRIAPRPLLLVSAAHDACGSRAAAERLHAAAGETRQVLWVEAGQGDLPARALEAIGPFLRRHLGLAGA